MTKTCIKCLETKPATTDYFFKDKKSLTGECKECRRKRYNRERAEARLACLQHYGQRRCACCGEMREEFLSLDHTNGGGAQHRRELGLSGKHLFQYLVRNGFPTDPPLRVLCMNCNWSLGRVGYCPHQKEN